MSDQVQDQVVHNIPTAPKQSATPQLILLDASGHHSGNLDETTERLYREGSWKKQRIITLLPAGDMMPTRAALAFANLMYPPNQGVVKMLAEGFEVGHAYSKAIEAILAHPELSEWEYILTMEIDNIPPPDGVLKLLQAMEENPEYAAISGLYFTKGPGGVAQCWGDPSDMTMNWRPVVPKRNEIMRVNGIGMGFALWRLSMFKDPRIPKPWFRTRASSEEGIGTQDLFFCQNAGTVGYKFACDARVKTGHLDYSGHWGEKGKIW